MSMKPQHKRSPFVEYFANIWAGIVTTLVGMKITLNYLRRPSTRITMMYPEEKPVIPAGHRGIHVFEEDNCSACKGCVKACPVDCITVESVGRGKDTMITKYEIDYTKCLFCELCTEPCPTKCILMGPEYDLSRFTREGCIIDFAKPKTQADIDAHLAMIAKKDAEKKAKAEAEKKAKEVSEGEGKS